MEIVSPALKTSMMKQMLNWYTVGTKINICQKIKQRNGFGFLKMASVVACLLNIKDRVILVEGHEGSAPSSTKAMNDTLFQTPILEKKLQGTS